MIRSASLASVILAGVLAGCVAAPPLPPSRGVRPADLPSLAGQWDATTKSGDSAGIGVARARYVIQADGTLMVFPTVAATPGPGRIWVEGTKLRLESSFVDAILTLHEGDGRRLLRGSGILKGTGREIEVELTPAGQ